MQNHAILVNTPEGSVSKLKEIGEIMNHDPDKDSLGPISKMPDSTSSVFISVVTFAFIGGLYNIDQNKKNNL